MQRTFCLQVDKFYTKQHMTLDEVIHNDPNRTNGILRKWGYLLDISTWSRSITNVSPTLSHIFRLPLFRSLYVKRCRHSFAFPSCLWKPNTIPQRICSKNASDVNFTQIIELSSQACTMFQWHASSFMLVATFRSKSPFICRKNAFNVIS